MRKLTACLMFALTACLTACTGLVPQAALVTVNQSEVVQSQTPVVEPHNAVVTPADECFVEAMAYDPSTGECVTSSFWSETPGLLLP